MEEESKVSLKLLIDTRANKVLFAEVGKNFVDFLFHILSLPMGTIIKLLNNNVDNMVGSLGSLYKSVDSLSADYFQPNINKESVLNPRPPVTVPVPLLALTDNAPAPLYVCTYYPAAATPVFVFQGSGRGCVYYTDCQYTECPNCRTQMSTVLSYVAPTTGGTPNTPSGTGGGDGGYVKGLVTYMVMDNLEVKPMSNISGITLMAKFRVKDVSVLEEKEVQVGLKEGLAILKASLEVTDTVLTTVFLPKWTAMFM